MNYKYELVSVGVFLVGALLRVPILKNELIKR